MKLAKIRGYIRIIILLGFCTYLIDNKVDASDKTSADNDNKILTLQQFIELATKNDKVFEQILIDQLKLKYRKNLILPPGDLVIEVKGQYNLYLESNKEEPEAALSLSKLFPFNGTEVSLSYNNIPTESSDMSRSEMQFLISLPIARNAFGRATKLLDSITGIENDIIRYQIIEAYEDYLSSLVATYYNWYSAYENLKIGEASYQSNLRLLKNIRARQKQKIALPIDVNKVELLLLRKKEVLVGQRQIYKNLTNLIEKSIRYEGRGSIDPIHPSGFHKEEIIFDKDYRQFTTNSRTYKILNMLVSRSSLEVEKNADDILPSTNLLLGYKIEGDDWSIKDSSEQLFSGMSVRWPLYSQVERAELELSKIEHKKTRLSNQNKYLELYTNLKNIYLQIRRETDLLKIAKRKIKLAEAILKDETENYSFGKITLNDYIDAVNTTDENKFNRISHIVQLKKLTIEWMRLTDKLVDGKTLN